jgi:hypothetical protein
VPLRIELVSDNTSPKVQAEQAERRFIEALKSLAGSMLRVMALSDRNEVREILDTIQRLAEAMVDLPKHEYAASG